MAHTHRYPVRCQWEGSTGVGYDAYDRSHTVSAGGGADGSDGSEGSASGLSLALSADPAFLGDPAKLNPEQLLVLAASSCQLLSFLAAAARARIDVIAYEDDAEGVMPEDDRPVRITRIALRPRITVRGDVAEERVRHLVEVGHRECFIANSLRSEVVVEPDIVFER
jgi:organic hydroperoxide reductase OsmC/OhrA